MDIFNAIVNNDLARVNQLISQGIDINRYDNNGSITPLMLASMYGHLLIVKKLIEHNANVNQYSEYIAHGNTALLQAVENERLSVVRELIEHNASVNTLDVSNMSPLLHACDKDNFEIFRVLITHGADVNASDYHGWSPITKASFNGNIEMVRELITRGANINHHLNDGQTALMLASIAGHIFVVEELIRRGANKNARDNNNDTALILAQRRGNVRVVQELERALIITPEVMPETNDPFARRLECIVCMVNAVNTRLNPCGHLICSTCFMRLERPRSCPACRTSPVTNESIFYGGFYHKHNKYISKLKIKGGNITMPHTNLPQNWLSVWDRLTEDQKTKVNEIVNKGLDYLRYLNPASIDNNTFEENYNTVRSATGIWELDDYAPDYGPPRIEIGTYEPTPEDLAEIDAALDRLDAREAENEAEDSSRRAEIEAPPPEVERARSEEERRFGAYEHMIDLRDWREISKRELTDPITYELYREPYVASDGRTYSKHVLEGMFSRNPSPRGVNGQLLTRLNGEVGILNIELVMMINKFKEGKLKISEN
jgi:ankyrin repeat protein